jgi:hypothetical protein
VNKGLLHARGEVLAWINGDDEVIPAAIDEALAHLAANPECQVVYAGIDFTDAVGVSRREYRPAPWPLPALPAPGRLCADPGDPLPPRAAGGGGLTRRALGRRRRLRLLPAAHARGPGRPAPGQDEALQIRLRWARNRRDRALMIGFDRLKRAALPTLTRGRWPAPFASDR